MFRSINSRLLKKKLFTLVFISVSAGAFATLGDGRDLRPYSSRSLMTRPVITKGFTLKSGYNYRGNNLFNQPESNRFIMLNKVVTYQKGNGTYILPLKKKVFMGKVKINPLPPRF